MENAHRYELPKLAELLGRPEFDALKQFLAQHQIDPQTLQAQIDQLVEQARNQT